MANVKWMLAAVLGVAVVGACGDQDGAHPCAEGACVCQDDNLCELDCDADDCELGCDGVSVCDVSCGDFCEYGCADGSECYLLCDDVCTATCDSVSTCEVDCGEDCDVQCTSLSACRVAMLSGIATCDAVSECTIDCVVPGGLEPAIECGDGVFACGPCP